MSWPFRSKSQLKFQLAAGHEDIREVVGPTIEEVVGLFDDQSNRTSIIFKPETYAYNNP